MPYDDNNLPSLYEKIKSAKYIMPRYLTYQAKDLIKRLMHPNPLERLTIAEIKNHPWYLIKLPFYLQVMDVAKPDIEDKIDEEIFAMVCEVMKY